MNPRDTMSAAYADIEQKQNEERQAVIDATQEAAAVEMKADLRRKFLTLPGATETEFESLYPALLADHRRRQMEALV